MVTRAKFCNILNEPRALPLHVGCSEVESKKRNVLATLCPPQVTRVITWPLRTDKRSSCYAHGIHKRKQLVSIALLRIGLVFCIQKSNWLAALGQNNVRVNAIIAVTIKKREWFSVAVDYAPDFRADILRQYCSYKRFKHFR